EQVSEHLDVDLAFLLEVVPADVSEDVCPMVVKLEVIDAAFVLEQSAVVASGEVEGPMSLIDGPECVQKPSPARVRRHFQWRNAVPGLFDQLFGQQSAVFAERDEDD